jgi:hypothetical protein
MRTPVDSIDDNASGPTRPLVQDRELEDHRKNVQDDTCQRITSV